MTSTATISPTEVNFFANHTSDTLRSIVETKTADSLYMALNGGSELATEALKIANAAWGQLILRGEG